MLEVRGVRKAFPGVVALDGVDLDVRRGEVHVLLGENGAGKSTLMKILSGAMKKDAGETLIDGRLVAIGSPREAQALGIAIIYQDFNLVPQLSVGENVFLGREPTRWPGVVDRRRVFTDTARLLGDLGVHFDPRRTVRELGVAEQQMVEVAKALSTETRILVMDEPTSALTENETRELFAAIQRLASTGVGIIYISHRMEEVFRIGNRVTVLRDGRNVGTRRLGDTSVTELVMMMANRELAEHLPRQQTGHGGELLRVERLCCGERVRDISFVLHRGEILGIAGLLGAGRTELARAIVGADSRDSGRVVVKGEALRPARPTDAIRRGIGFLPEDRKAHGVVPGLSVQRNIGLPHLDWLSRLGVVDGTQESRVARRSVDDLRIRTPHLDQPVVLLSGGNQQKVVLAKWLAGDADILVFDEPTRGIDVAAKEEIYRLMNRLTARGAGIILISSELPEILGMSDRILVMHQGRISAEFSREMASQARLLEAALGLAS